MNEKKVREAIETIEELRYLMYVIDSSAIPHLTMAIEALEKQLPKKPMYEGDGFDRQGNIVLDTWICPNCGVNYEVDYDDYDYCYNCGQRIDLSEQS